jgi:hypothetical protein
MERLSRDDIDRLFTDVVLPGEINGRQLADEAARRLKLKVCYSRPDIRGTRSYIMAGSIRVFV